MSKAIWIGGPRNGKLVDVPDGRDVLKFAETTGSPWYRDNVGPYDYPGVDYKTVTCEVFKLRLAPGRDITGIRHPEIKEDTARMYLADLVIGAWTKEIANPSYRF